MLTGKGNDESDKHEERIENLGSQTKAHWGPVGSGVVDGGSGAPATNTHHLTEVPNVVWLGAWTFDGEMHE